MHIDDLHIIMLKCKRKSEPQAIVTFTYCMRSCTHTCMYGRCMRRHTSAHEHMKANGWSVFLRGERGQASERRGGGGGGRARSLYATPPSPPPPPPGFRKIVVPPPSPLAGRPPDPRPDPPRPPAGTPPPPTPGRTPPPTPGWTPPPPTAPPPQVLTDSWGGVSHQDQL